MKKLLIMSLALVGTLALVGAASAATPADQLQPAGATYNENVAINGELNVSGITRLQTGVHIGTPGSGGVTYFNGSIVNAGDAVTIADDLRVDGAIYRTEVGGNNAIKISDDIVPSKNNYYNLGSDDYKWARIQANIANFQHLTADDILLDGDVGASNGYVYTEGVRLNERNLTSGSCLMGGELAYGSTSGLHTNIRGLYICIDESWVEIVSVTTS
ncbi:MAG: hypothetical protein HQ530_02540 [Parcubacteria group bacterium]|nr:hypothetical protein [Parcubacteria group bacterium]